MSRNYDLDKAMTLEYYHDVGIVSVFYIRRRSNISKSCYLSDYHDIGISVYSEDNI